MPLGQIDNTKISVSFRGEEIIPEESGYLGQLESKNQHRPDILALVVTVSDESYHGFMVDGQKNVSPSRDLNQKSLTPGIKVFRQKMPIKFLSHLAVWHTEYAENNLRLLKLELDGSFCVWEIAIISQDGCFFLTKQRTYESRCYRDESGQLVCPDFEKWPQLVHFLKTLVESPESLEAVESWSPKPGIDGSDLEPGTARVIWWNCAQGLGAIAAPEGAARVHWTELPIGDELAYLSKGQLVSYSCFKPPESTCGRSTSFQREAVAVTPLGV